MLKPQPTSPVWARAGSGRQQNPMVKLWEDLQVKLNGFLTTGRRLGLGRDVSAMGDAGFASSLSRGIDLFGRSSTLHLLNFVLAPEAVVGPVRHGAFRVVRLRRKKRAPTPSLRSDYGHDERHVLSFAAPPGRSERLHSLRSLRCSTRTSLRAVRSARFAPLQLSTERRGRVGAQMSAPLRVFSASVSQNPP